MDLKQIVIIAFLIEAVVNLLVTIYVWEDGKTFLQCVRWKVVLAIVVGEFVAFGFGADLFTILGFVGKTAWAGTALSGLVLSRGSNFVHDAIQFVNNMKTKIGAEAEIAKAVQPEPFKSVK